MAHHKKRGIEETPANTNGWFVSYADMITALLAMFIALSTLGRDQTGISLNKGLGSYRDWKRQLGVPGLFPTTSRTVHLENPGPVHSVDDPSDQPSPPTPSSDPSRVIDGEEERLQRFLDQMRSQFALNKRSPVAGETSVDFFAPLGDRSPMLKNDQREKILPLLAIAGRPDYRGEIVVWALTPSQSGCLRATQQAIRLREELAEMGGLDRVAQGRLVAVGQPWRFRDVRRPVFSFVIKRHE